MGSRGCYAWGSRDGVVGSRGRGGGGLGMVEV